MLQGRITEQRDVGIWNEVWEPSSTSFILTSKPLKWFSYHQTALAQTAPLSCFSISHVRGMLIVARWVSADRGGNSRWRGEALIHQVEVKCNGDSKCKIDKWLITSSNEMIHHFLKLSSFKECGDTSVSPRLSQSAYASAFSSRQMSYFLIWTRQIIKMLLVPAVNNKYCMEHIMSVSFFSYFILICGYI